MFNIQKLFNKKVNDTSPAKEEIAKMLKVTPEALNIFEDTYQKRVLLNDLETNNIFEINAKQAAGKLTKQTDDKYRDIETRIIDELLAKTEVYRYEQGRETSMTQLLAEPENLITREELSQIPLKLRPQLTGTMMRRDIDKDSYLTVLMFYHKYLNERDEKKKQSFYGMFRQGLDIMDLDPIVYEIIGMNPSSIGYWFPSLIAALRKQIFFKVPDTTIIRVPISLLQLTRMPYEELTPSTIRILDAYCMRAFELDMQKEYFIKTGTYSSKFDFRNAHICDTKEIKELGEYLMYIHYQALLMASPLNNVSIYGVSTTNEWVVREYINDIADTKNVNDDKNSYLENTDTPLDYSKACIYHGLKLRNELRVFVDFDTDNVLGIFMYWDPSVMKRRFGCESDSNEPDKIHDYIIFSMFEAELTKRFNETKDLVVRRVNDLLPYIDLQGQWSIDVMEQNVGNKFGGGDFYIIDMAPAQNSAFYDRLPESLRKPMIENWLPKMDFFASEI